MNKQIDISIIIPCYNDGQYIQEAINSVLVQTYQNFEIIIIDDASSDLNTKKILQNISHNKITLIKHNVNKGLSAARNTGIDHAQGTYILPLDADDKIAPTYLEKAKSVPDNDSEIGIVYCEAELFGTIQGKWELPKYSFPEILIGNMIFATAMFKKADWGKVGGYNKNMTHGYEDYDFWLSLLELDVKVYCIPEVLFFYRQKKTSMIKELEDDKEIKLKTWLQLLENHKELYKENIEVVYTWMRKEEREIQEKGIQLQEKNRYIQNQDAQIQHWHNVAQSLRVKNRIKRVIKKVIPKKLWIILKYLRHNPSSIRQGLHILKTQGFRTLLQKIKKVDTLPKGRLVNSYTYVEPDLTKQVKDELRNLSRKPLISIIMPVYNVDPKWLELAVKSIEQQWYENWELCIVDDKSSNKETLQYLKKLKHPKIKVKFSEVNGNISVASNEALKVASGEFVALMDNDDELTPDALYEVIKAINTQDAEFIYSDEDKLDMDGTFCDPHFKPDYAPDMFLSQNYMSHLGVIKKELIDKVDGFTVGLEGAQDYDLYLKVLEYTDKVYHIQKVLYHWRKIPRSTAAKFGEKLYAQEAGVKALQNAMRRRGIAAKVHNGKHPGTYRVKYKIKDTPLVSITIPFKDKPELLRMCIESILEKTTYKNFEVIGISNNSEKQGTFDEMKRLESLDERIKFYKYNVPFNYSDINNHAVRTYAKGEQILLLNNDIEIITPEWIEAMLEFSQREDVGVVGAKLYYPNDTLQHAGVIIGIGGIAGHSHKHFLRSDAGYFSRLDLVQNLSAVTAACFMVKRHIFEEVDGLNEDELKIVFNDVDFCLRVQDKGYLNLFTPYCEAYHHESISRGFEDTVEKQDRFNTEIIYMQKRHKSILENGDPYYNPNLTLSKEDFSYAY